jgi:flagellar basal-body rod modification protein FlgD
MSVTPTSAATTATATKSSSAAQSGSMTNSLTADFNTFLRLLTTQMENQDPLEPTTNTEFIAQLASFSSVEQQVVTNQMLESLLDEFSMGATQGLAEWIGKDVLVSGAKADYQGNGVTVEVTPVADADRADLVVRNAQGTIVARLPVDPRAAELTWNGNDQNGTSLANGFYSFALDSYRDGVVTGSQDGKVFSTVAEVRLVEGRTELVVADGTTIAAADVTAMR